MTKKKVYKLSNSMWTGLYGKKVCDDPNGDQFLSLEEMCGITANAEYQGRKFSCIDLVCDPRHIDLLQGASHEAKRVAELLRMHGLKARSITPALWQGSSIGSNKEKLAYINAFTDALAFGVELAELGVRDKDDGYFLVDSACSPAEFEMNKELNLSEMLATLDVCVKAAYMVDEKIAIGSPSYSGGMQNINSMLQTGMYFSDYDNGLDRQIDFSSLLGYVHKVDSLFGDNAKAVKRFNFRNKKQLRTFWDEIAEELEGFVDDVYVSQSNGTICGLGTKSVSMNNCLPYDPEAKIDHKMIAPLILIPECRDECITTLTWIGRGISNSELRKSSSWSDVLKYLVEIETSVNEALKNEDT